MRSLIPCLIFLSVVARSTSALEPGADPNWIIDGQIEDFRLWGTPVDQDRELYRAIGLEASNSDGSVVEPVQPIYSGPVLGVGLWRWIDSAFQAGLDLHAGWAFTEHSGTLSGSTELALSQQSLVAGARWLPLVLPTARMVRFGVQGGLGLSMATLHRYAIADDHLDGWSQAALAAGNSAQTVATFEQFISTGHQDLSLYGWLWQAQIRGQAERSNIFVAFHLGFQGQHLTAGKDPIAGQFIYNSAGATILTVPSEYSTLEFLFGAELGTRF
ncbi:MAG TPA: hypothetical protein VN931_03450 [Fibrobacteria bacterium]|jgi:hypothetical protein|nr:hypothetical protein [Fibrobacteria bacterium]